MITYFKISISTNTYALVLKLLQFGQPFLFNLENEINAYMYETLGEPNSFMFDIRNSDR